EYSKEEKGDAFARLLAARAAKFEKDKKKSRNPNTKKHLEEEDTQEEVTLNTINIVKLIPILLKTVIHTEQKKLMNLWSSRLRKINSNNGLKDLKITTKTTIEKTSLQC
ncbi:40964_t:CDS:1, partial [Gigaspora margarita]